jgi:hypothetical protein
LQRVLRNHVGETLAVGQERQEPHRPHDGQLGRPSL